MTEPEHEPDPFATNPPNVKLIIDWLTSWFTLLSPDAEERGLDVESMVQDAAFTCLEKYDHDKACGRSKSFVSGVARHVFLQALESTRNRREVRMSTTLATGLVNEVTGVTAAAIRSELLGQFRDEVTRWKKGERDLYRLRVLEGRSGQEIAAELGTTPNAVAQRWKNLVQRTQGRPWYRSIVADLLREAGDER